MFRRRRRGRNPYFVRNFTTQIFPAPQGGGNVSVTDTVVISPNQIVSSAADRMWKGVSVAAIDWRSDVTFISQTGGTAITTLQVMECLYKAQSQVAGAASEFTGQAFLTNNELGGAGGSGITHWPARIIMRRAANLWIFSSGQDNVLGTNNNWLPLRIRNRIRLASDEALWWRLEIKSYDGTTAAAAQLNCGVLAAVAYRFVL